MANCECGCGGEMREGTTWKYLRGHKPSGSNPPPSKALAKRQAQIVIDPPAAEEEYVTCEISVAQIEAIWQLLNPRQRAVAILSGVEAE